MHRSSVVGFAYQTSYAPYRGHYLHPQGNEGPSRVATAQLTRSCDSSLPRLCWTFATATAEGWFEHYCPMHVTRRLTARPDTDPRLIYKGGQVRGKFVPREPVDGPRRPPVRLTHTVLSRCCQHGSPTQL